MVLAEKVIMNIPQYTSHSKNHGLSGKKYSGFTQRQRKVAESAGQYEIPLRIVNRLSWGNLIAKQTATFDIQLHNIMFTTLDVALQGIIA